MLYHLCRTGALGITIDAVQRAHAIERLPIRGHLFSTNLLCWRNNVTVLSHMAYFNDGVAELAPRMRDTS